MTTVQLTDTQLAQFTACGLVVVDGERMPWVVEAKQNKRGTWCVYVNGSFISDHAGHEGARYSAQQINKAGPPDLSTLAPELWRKLTEPCATCGGIEVVSSPHQTRSAFGTIHSRDLAPCPNPDCDRGRQVVALTATCPRCDGDGVVDEDEIEQWHEPTMFCGEDDDNHCDCGSPLCPSCRDGVVTLGRFLVAVRALDDGRFEIAFEPVAALTDSGAPARPVNPGTEAL